MSKRAYGKENQFNARFPVRNRKVFSLGQILSLFTAYFCTITANYSNDSINLGSTGFTSNGSERIGKRGWLTVSL